MINASENATNPIALKLATLGTGARSLDEKIGDENKHLAPRV